ncbi:MAG: class II aldolase/adducin family protein [Dehalococcoidia bacterium]|nr:class II aldolase/adducin family protein [Dehalococcoidia bacterium]
MSTESNALTFSAVFLAKYPPGDARIAQLAAQAKKFHSLGLVHDLGGNLSFRTRLGFIISGTGVSLDALTQGTVAEVTGVVYGLNKTSVYIKGAVVPSRETILHSQIYEELPEINAIFHLHDKRLMSQAEKLGVPVTANERPAGSSELAQEAINLLKTNKSLRFFVLKGRGVIFMGTSLDEAGRLAEQEGGKQR